MPGGNHLMYQDYFIIDNVKYYTGTTFLVKNMGKEEKSI